MESTPARRPRAAALAAIIGCVLLAAVLAYAADVPIATVPVGKSPTAVAVDPVAHRVYVANFYGDTVTVINSVTDSTIATITMPKGYAIGAVPNAVVVDPLATPPKAYVANWQSHIVSIIDGTSLSAIATITVPTAGGGNPRALAINPSSTPPKLYVADYGRSVVSVLNATNGSLIKEIGVGLQPRALGIFVSAPRTRIYVANRGSNTVSVIDGDTDTIVATLPTGVGPKSIAVDSNSGFAYVSSPTSNTVTAIDASDTVAAVIPVGTAPIGMGIEGGANRLFVANRDSNNISVIDTVSRAVVATIPAGVQPVAVSIDRGDRKAFVGNYGGSTVTIIDRNLAVTTCTVGVAPIALASDESLVPHKAYCSNWTSDTVTVIDEPAAAPLAVVSPSSLTKTLATDPVTATVDPISGDTTNNPTPRLTGSATCVREPFVSNVVAVLVSVDGGAARKADITSGAGTPHVTWSFTPSAPLPPGSHAISVQVWDSASAASANAGQDAVSAISGSAGSAAYAFTVTPPPPHVVSISPDAGLPGTVITFTGSGFGATQGTGWATFGGTPGLVVSWSDTTVTAQVPSGAGAGYAGIVQGGIVSNGVEFSPSSRPRLDGVSVSTGGPGTQVVFSGSGFGSVQASGSVTFTGTSAPVVSWCDTQVVATVPVGAQSGYAGIVQGGLASNGAWFVPFSAPVVNSLSSWWGTPGSVVTISGIGFGATQGGGWVTFGGTPGQVVSWSDTSITVTAPSTSWSGYVGVVQNDFVSNGIWFVVLAPPVVNSVTPASASIGATLTIEGSGFGASQGTSWVTLGGASAPVVSWEDTRVVATVPTGATPGYAGIVRDGVTSNGIWVNVGSAMPAVFTTFATARVSGSSLDLISRWTLGRTTHARALPRRAKYVRRPRRTYLYKLLHRR
jgi:YVTN family beta-propeller protein